MTYRHLVSLGSSFAAGPGIPPIIDKSAMRSGRNYPHLLAERLGAELTDLTVSGATTETILREPQRTMRGGTFAPQIDGVPADADLATVTIGGNDLGYIGSLMRASAIGLIRKVPLLGLAGSALASRIAPTPPDDEAIDRVTAGMVEVVEQVRARAPKARVVLVDYFTLLGPDARSRLDLALRPNEIEAFRAISNTLDGIFVSAAATTGADLVKVSELSRSHGLGSAEPWVIGLRPGGGSVPFHATLAGMQAAADAIAGLLETS